MAHKEQIDFCTSVKLLYPQYFNGTFVLDIGSFDVNGNNQYLFDSCGYLGVDLAPGRNVDICVPGHKLLLPDETFDVAISTECAEHDKHYIETLRNIVRLLKPGGLFIFTCATTGRPEHGTVSKSPQDAPALADYGDWAHYYKNLEKSDFCRALDVGSTFKAFEFSTNERTHDLYFWGIKTGEWNKRTDYSFQLNAQNNSVLQNLLLSLDTTQNIHKETTNSLLEARDELAETELLVQELQHKLTKTEHSLEENKTQLSNTTLSLDETRNQLGMTEYSLEQAENALEVAHRLHRRRARQASAQERHIQDLNAKCTELQQRLQTLEKKRKKLLINRIRAKTRTLLSTVGFNSKKSPIASKHCRAMPPRLNLFMHDTIYILTTSHTRYVAELLRDALNAYDIEAEVIYGEPPSGFSSCPHFVISPQSFKKLPPLYVAYQMEQTTSQRWFSDEYIQVLEHSFAIFDYSLKNINYLHSRGLTPKQTFYMPLSLPRERQCPPPHEGKGSIDVLFYGDPTSPRRRKLLDELKRHFNVEVASEVFGEELYDKISRSRLVINIHYYEEALLETTRIFECLSMGKIVISEEASDQNEHKELSTAVTFVRAGDTEQMITTIGALLSDHAAYKARHDSVNNFIKHSPRHFLYYVGRFLLAHDEISFEDFYAVAGNCIQFQSDKICLGLPEYRDRQINFEKDNNYGFEMFPGLRHTAGWVGCGLSYKFMVRKAKEQGLSMVTICEDDVEFPRQWAERFANISEYLKQHHDWHVFSGLIADLNKDVTVKKINNHSNEDFIYIDRMVSTVMNVYSQRFYDKLLQWDSTDRDVHKNTIDRYIESQGSLEVVTTCPFLVGHKEEQHSTIWGFENSQYKELISKTTRLLDDKLRAFRIAANAQKEWE